MAEQRQHRGIKPGREHLYRPTVRVDAEFDTALVAKASIALSAGFGETGDAAAVVREALLQVVQDSERRQGHEIDWECLKIAPSGKLPALPSHDTGSDEPRVDLDAIIQESCEGDGLG